MDRNRSVIRYRVQNLVAPWLLPGFLLVLGSCATRDFHRVSQSRMEIRGETKRISRRSPQTFEADIRSNQFTYDEKAMPRVKTAKVVIADYGQLVLDFPFLKTRSRKEIRQWLLDRVAYVNPQQVNAPTNETVPIQLKEDGEEPVTTDALRPASYGRASVFRVLEEQDPKKKARVIEAKGTGTFEPQIGSHSNGLATFNEAMREYHYQKLVQVLMNHAGVKVDTVPIYAAIHLGFNVKFASDDGKPAGLIVRAAIPRKGPLANEAGIPLFQNTQALERARSIELALRRYGITTTTLSEAGGERIEFINVQFSQDGSIVDFGNYGYQDTFTIPLVFPEACAGSPEAVTGKVFKPTQFGCVHPQKQIFVLRAGQPGYVSKADPALRLDETHWKSDPAAKVRNRSDPLSREAIELGRRVSSLSDSEIEQEALRQHCTLLTPVLKRLGMNENDLTSTEECDAPNRAEN